MLQKVVKDRFAYAYAWQDNGFSFCTQDSLLITRGGYSHTLPIRVCAAQRGRDFEAPGLERGIHFRRGF